MTDLPVRPLPDGAAERASSTTTGVDVQGFPADPMFSAGLDKAARLQHENDHLRRILGTQPVIEQAKGVLMQRFGIDAEMAFQLLIR
ncbi:ANTAR domain-containing protein [Aeromicrobium sp.]|uniref:ANTAR domain-containing protein n=1 Tax=Aeromicrobium sp. TaxID=1871063 RepID=UPI001998B15B|nr:ANTAR domain-containing protein [Aeromicrobium sp.]MBC7631358.1 ANTAR domain-containing protein [Aeromicrobium sp.]